jgi:hypothetical protein
MAMMSLGAILELTGRLTDQSGANTARERFRRFLASEVPGLSGVRSLVAQAQQSDDEQGQRALGDLVVALGRFVGCEVTYGAHVRTSYGARVSGTWSSPDIRIAVDVCIFRDEAPGPDAQGRREESRGLPTGEQPAPLRILVPRHQSADNLVNAPSLSDASVVTLERVITLADQVDQARLTCPAALDALLRPESVRSTDADRSERQGGAPQADDPAGADSVTTESRAEFWIATIVEDEGVAPELLIEKVIGQRRVLPASRLGMFLPSARPGDWVCFFVGGGGVAGWGRLHALVDPLTAPVRRAHRFTSIFSLTSVSFHAEPVPLDLTSLPQRLANRSPLGVAGSFLSPISEHDFQVLTAGSLSLTIDR